MKLPSFVAGAHPSISLGFGVEPGQGGGRPTLIVGCLWFHFRVPL